MAPTDKEKEKEAKEADKAVKALEIKALNEVNKSIFQAVKTIKTGKADTKEENEVLKIVNRDVIKKVVNSKNFNPVHLVGVMPIGRIFDKLRNNNAYGIGEVYNLIEKFGQRVKNTDLTALQDEKSSRLFNVLKLHRLGELTTSQAIKAIDKEVGEPIIEKTDKNGVKTVKSALSKGFATWLYINHRAEFAKLNLYTHFEGLDKELHNVEALRIANAIQKDDTTVNIENVVKSLDGCELFDLELRAQITAKTLDLATFVAKVIEAKKSVKVNA